MSTNTSSNPASFFNPLSNLGTFAPSSGVSESVSQRLAQETMNRIGTGEKTFNFTGRGSASQVNYYLVGGMIIAGYVAYRVIKK